MRRLLRRLSLILAALIGAALLLAGFAFSEARRDPVVRTAHITLPGWRAGAAQVRVLLASDVHLGSVVMGEARLTRMVARINALRPDLVVLAGDFIDGHEPGSARHQAAALTGALSGLRPPLGTIAVLGNHDQWTNAVAVTQALRRAGVIVLSNDAVQRGPLAIGGVDDDYTGHARLPPTLAKLRALPGARLMVSHAPDLAPRLPRDVPLLLAGHTHCGQVVLPLIGAPMTPSRFGDRYRCGLIREGGRLTVVTAGLGTSVVPFRLGAPPDVWLLTIGPVRGGPAGPPRP